MPLKTIPVRFIANAPGSQVFSGATVTVDLIDSLGNPSWDTDDSIIVPKPESGNIGGSGEVILNLWPNSRGVRNTKYLVHFQSPYGLVTIKIRVPDGDPSIILNADRLVEVPNSIPAGSSLAQTLMRQMATLLAEVQRLSDRMADIIGGGLIPIPYTITNTASFVADHTRNYSPAVVLLDQLGNQVETDVHHEPGRVVLVFSQPFTGQLYLN